jgi:hypothetical protein
MGKRKVFYKTDLTVPKVERSVDSVGQLHMHWEVVPPASTLINFPKTTIGWRSFDFADWYGKGIDPIAFACQRQIERFLAKQDLVVTTNTVINYCTNGVKTFLTFLVERRAATVGPLTLYDINRDVIDDYLLFLREKGTKSTSQRTIYQHTKAILEALGRRGLVDATGIGDHALFPRNPFPNNERKSKGESPLPRAQRKLFTAAVKTAVMPLFIENSEPTSELLSYAILVVALHTGRNTCPLLEMSPESLRTHPKDDTSFLVLYKRRGHSFNKVVLRGESPANNLFESTPSIRPTVSRLINRVIELTASLRAEAPEDLKHCIWLFRSQKSVKSTKKGQVTALTTSRLAQCTKKLVNDYGLHDSDGKPLRLNVSRLRKTFVNRVNEILEGDIVTTAIAAGNTPRVTSVNYLRPGEDSQRNWKFLGQALVKELLTETLGATEKTPVGRCTDAKNGQFAPRMGGATCMSFLNCVRCRNYVVTGDDLYRLFSFYWRVMRERARMDKKRWERQFSHIVRLIDRDVIELGVIKGVFKQKHVDEARERARNDPHPYWCSDVIVEALEGLR